MQDGRNQTGRRRDRLDGAGAETPRRHSGKELDREDLAALNAGLPNLLRHIDNIRNVYGLPCVVAVNAFPTDTEAELHAVAEACCAHGAKSVLSEVWAKGGDGGRALAEEVVRLCETENHFAYAYDENAPIEEKLEAVAKKIYGADGIQLTAAAKTQAETLARIGFGKTPVCIAKTQYSFSDDPKKKGAPSGFTVTVRQLKASCGAGFVVALTGDIMTMPGLPARPAAEKIDVDENGVISGLF